MFAAMSAMPAKATIGMTDRSGREAAPVTNAIANAKGTLTERAATSGQMPESDDVWSRRMKNAPNQTAANTESPMTEAGA